MRSQNGFTLVEVMVVLVIMAIAAVIVSPDMRKALGFGKATVVNEQAVKAQDALSAWVTEQKSITAAAAQFAPGPSGELVPKDLAGLVAQMNSYWSTEKDAMSVVDGHIVTNAMNTIGAYMDIVWPQPYRKTYPHINLTNPQ